jgi:CubicO group peptidase (beta-lactamase class C family)
MTRDHAAPRPPLSFSSRTTRVSLALGTVLAAAALAPLTVSGQSDEAAAARVDDVFAEWSTDASPGCAVGVTRYGETVFERAYGMADLEFGVPNDPGSIFEGGSVSKQFTSAAVVLLALDGVLSLDDDVRRWIPELPDYGKTITLHHLMTHTSGIRDWGSVASISGWGREERSHDHDDVLDILSHQSALNFEPGHEYSYSNSGYNLLAMVVTRASGIPFADFSKQRIFEPLGMKDTQWRDDYRRIVPGRSTAYDRIEDGWEINRPIEYVHGNGGILTTVHDLGIWNQALTDGRLGGDAFLEMMHRQGRLNDGSEMGYAGGLMIGELGGARAVTHTGSTAGYRAFLGRYPEQGLSVAMLCNASNVSTGGSGEQIARAFLGSSVRDAADPDYASASAGYDLQRYAGLYREPVTGNATRLEVRDGVLHRGDTPLLPLSDSEFQVGAGDGRLRFAMEGRGVTGFTVENRTVIEEPWDRVEPWSPSAAGLAQFEGTYHSDDAETTFVVTVAGDGLQLWQRPNDTTRVEPVYEDGFRGRGWVVRFRRDADGVVNELSLSLGRVYDMRFQRVPGM